MLSNRLMAPLVLSEGAVQTIDITDYFLFHGLTRAGAVNAGDFSCCLFNHMSADGTPIPCDKARIQPMLWKMWRSKIRAARASANSYALTNYSCCETQLFARSPCEPFRAGWGQLDGDHSPELTLARIDDDVRNQRVMGEAIHIACKLGDERLIRMCVERGDDPLAPCRGLGGPLGYTCVTGNVAAVEYLLSLPAINAAVINRPAGSFEIPPLWRAACNGHEPIVQSLVRSLADVAVRRGDGRTALHGAAAHGHLAVAHALLAAGAPVDVSDSSGDTPLHMASSGMTLWGSQEHMIDVVDCLLKSRASAAIRNREGLTAYDIALQKGNCAAQALLLAVASSGNQGAMLGGA